MSTPPIAEIFANQIYEVVNQFRDQGITMCEVVGVIELLKNQLIKEAVEDADD